MRLPSSAPSPADTSLPDLTAAAASRDVPVRTAATQRLVGVAATAIIVAALYAGQDLLIPLALAGIFSFLLLPLATRLQRWGMSRLVSVSITVCFASAVVLLIALVVIYQVVQLADSLPQYQSNIEQKIDAVRSAPAGPVNRLRALFRSIERRVTAPELGETPGTDASSVPAAAEEQGAAPAPAVEGGTEVTPLGVAGYLLSTAIGPLTAATVVFVLVVFILLERDSIRSRLIRLLGSRPGQLYISTQALDDASGRVSRYLLMQLVVNLTYGIPILFGLMLTGVPSPFLWALLTIVLRFIPYVGPVLGAALPLALALAVDPGWSMFLWTLLLFIVVELISNNIVEPLLYGRSTGVSPLGIIVSAVFWAWLWGPIGLLIATPMTVCFVVIGQYIPAMAFFPLLLGDQPVLPLHARIYQRMLAMDIDEPDELSRAYLADHTLQQFFDEIVLPLLLLLEDERRFHSLEPSHRAFILDRVRDLIEDMTEFARQSAKPSAEPAAAAPGAPDTAAPAPATDTAKPAPPPDAAEQPNIPTVPPADAPPVVINIPLADESDELVGRMLSILLQNRGVAAATSRLHMPLPAAPSAAPQTTSVRVVCISALPPLGTVRARRQTARVRTELPGVAILLGAWESGPARNNGGQKRKHGVAGDVTVVASLSQALDRISGLLESK